MHTLQDRQGAQLLEKTYHTETGMQTQQQHAVTQAVLLITNLGPGDPCTGDRRPGLPARANSGDPAIGEQKHSNAACH
jgi:hypothetical protein